MSNDKIQQLLSESLKPTFTGFGVLDSVSVIEELLKVKNELVRTSEFVDNILKECTVIDSRINIIKNLSIKLAILG